MQSSLELQMVETQNERHLREMVNPPIVHAFDDEIVVGGYVYCILNHYLVAIVRCEFFTKNGVAA